MELTINNVVYQFNFGMGFLRNIDSSQKADSNGIKKNVGFQTHLAGLVDGDVIDLIDVLNAANYGQNPRVTVSLLDSYIDDPNTDVDALFAQVLDFLKSSNATRKQTQELLEQVEQYKARQENQ